MPPCSVDGCDKPAQNRKVGLCPKHYARQRRHGSPHVTLYREATGRCYSCAQPAPHRRLYCGKCERRSPQLVRRYGLELADVHDLAVGQDMSCSICQSCTEVLFVDHDHGTGEVRGLLCHRCNTAIGFLADDPTRADAAARYLRRHRPA